jgi:hypothetical protein
VLKISNIEQGMLNFEVCGSIFGVRHSIFRTKFTKSIKVNAYGALPQAGMARAFGALSTVVAAFSWLQLRKK